MTSVPLAICRRNRSATTSPAFRTRMVLSSFGAPGHVVTVPGAFFATDRLVTTCLAVVLLTCVLLTGVLLTGALLTGALLTGALLVGALLTLFVPGANLFTEAFGGVLGASDCTANPFEAGDVVARCFVIFSGVVAGLTARPDAFAFEVEFFGGGFFVIVRC